MPNTANNAKILLIKIEINDTDGDGIIGLGMDGEQ
jgi:hypothetical protein